MTFVHFINCVLLAFAPSYIIYKVTPLSEFGSLTRCLTAGFGYAATQLVKFIFFATFVPSSDGVNFDIVQEIIKGVVGMADLIGIHFLLGFVSGTGDLRILSVGLGWATAESAFMRLLQMWLGARSLEFTWTFIQMGIEANLSLLLFIALTAFVWLWGRKNLPQSLSSVVRGVFVSYLFYPIVIDFLRLELQTDSWQVLILEALYTITVAYLAKRSYTKYSHVSKRD